MKLLVVTPYFYPKIGGLENYAYNYSLGLKKKYGWEIVVVTSNHEAKKNRKEVVNGLLVYRLAPLFRLSNTPINPLWYWKIKRIIEKEKPDIINAHTPVPFIAEMASLASGTIPYILTYHAFSLYKQGINPLNLIIWSYNQIEKFFLNRAKKIIVVSDVIKENFSQNLQNKLAIIPNTIRQNELLPQNSNKKSNTILFVGSLDKTHTWKGLDLLLESIKMYIQKYTDNISLIVIGEGDWKKKYQEQAHNLNIQKHVTFAGLKTGTEKRKYFRKAKIAVIYPKTSNDALPTFLLESWANRLPVIASNILPISKLIKHNNNGILVKPNLPKSLSQNIFELLMDERRMNKLSERGYQTVKAHYLFEKQLDHYNKLLKANTNI